MIGERLRAMRILAGHTQESLAEILNIGIRQITRYENGETKPSGEVVAEIARSLNTTADYLLGLTDNPATDLTQNDLSEREKKAIAFWRQGNIKEAILEIVSDG